MSGDGSAVASEIGCADPGAGFAVPGGLRFADLAADSAVASAIGCADPAIIDP